jgi:hypothetical protein
MGFNLEIWPGKEKQKNLRTDKSSASINPGPAIKAALRKFIPVAADFGANIG